jgi:hypothetical protein
MKIWYVAANLCFFKLCCIKSHDIYLTYTLPMIISWLINCYHSVGNQLSPFKGFEKFLGMGTAVVRPPSGR